MNYHLDCTASKNTLIGVMINTGAKILSSKVYQGLGAKAHRLSATAARERGEPNVRRRLHLNHDLRP